MQTTAVSMPTPLASTLSRSRNLLPAAPSLTDRQSSFADILSMAPTAPVDAVETEEAKESAAKSTDAKARETAEKLVAVVLVQPILKQVRESNQAAEPFKPTRGEQLFQGMLDAKLAQEITQSARFPLVERLAQDMRQQMRTDAQPQFTATA